MHETKVYLYDRNPKLLEPAAMRNSTFALLQPLWRLGYLPQHLVTDTLQYINTVNSLQDLRDVDLIIEAIPEKSDWKVDLFENLHQICNAKTIFGTSTLTLDVNELTRFISRKRQFLGIRFFHPCVLVPPVEITPTNETGDEVVDSVVHFLSSKNKTCHRGPTQRVLSVYSIILTLVFV